MTSRAEAALGLARAGWLVFPCHCVGGDGFCSCGKPGCINVAKHPRWAKDVFEHGKDDASCDQAWVIEMWGRWPDANIGVVMGGGFFVLDLDAGSDETLFHLPPMPETLTVITGNGRHLWLTVPEGVRVRNKAKRFPDPGLGFAPELPRDPKTGRLRLPGIDVRGDGGYVLAPPSVHASGHVYEWVDAAADIAEAPPWLVELVMERAYEVPERPVTPPLRTLEGTGAYVRAALEGEVQNVLDAGWGAQNDTLNTAAFALGQLVGAGALPELVAETALLDAWDALEPGNGPGMRVGEKTIRSGLEAGMRQPRDIPEPRTRREAPAETSRRTIRTTPVKEAEGIVVAQLEPDQWTQATGNGHALVVAPPAVEYPLGVWPGPIAEFIEQTARSVCVAPEAVGTCVLAVVAGAVGRSRWLAVKDDWIERPGIYAGLVAASGERKSPALRAVKAPLEALHGEAAARWLKEHEAWESMPGKTAEPELAAPMLKDVTTEVLGLALRAHPRGVILVRPELVGWVKSHGQYKAGRGDDRQKWLEAHDQEQLDVRRVGRKPILVPHPVVSVLGGVQPAVFDAITSMDDGLAERFLYDVMPPQDLLASTPAVSRAARETWEAIVRELYGFVEAEVVCEAEGCLVEARQRALDLRRDASARMRSYYGKGEMHLARIAITLAAVWEVSVGSGRELTAAGVQRAEDLWGFHAAQAERLFTGDVVPVRAYEAASPGQESSVVAFVREQGGRCTKRELMNRGPLRQMRAKDADETLGALIARGQIGLESGPRKDSLIVVLL